GVEEYRIKYQAEHDGRDASNHLNLPHCVELTTTAQIRNHDAGTNLRLDSRFWRGWRAKRAEIRADRGAVEIGAKSLPRPTGKDGVRGLAPDLLRLPVDGDCAVEERAVFHDNCWRY